MLSKCGSDHTGGAGSIGKCIREEFNKAGARVCIIDIADNPYFVGDIGDEATLRRFAEKVIAEHGRVDSLNVAAASAVAFFQLGQIDHKKRPRRIAEPQNFQF